MLDTQEEHDRWLQENKQEINVKIRRGIAVLDRGKRIPEAQIEAHLAKLKPSLE